MTALNEPAEREACDKWAWAKRGFAVGELIPLEAAREGWLARARIAAEREAELVALLKRAQQHVPYLGETYRAISAALAPEAGR